MRPETVGVLRWKTVLALLGIALLSMPGPALSQTASGAPGGATRGGEGGGRDYGGGPARLLESRELPPPVKGLAEKVCEHGTLESSYYAGIFHYECLSPASAVTMKPGEPPAPRAKIGADCDEKDGKPVNCVWTCGADEDSDCSGFINNCVGEGGDVNGNKGSATCSVP